MEKPHPPKRELSISPEHLLEEAKRRESVQSRETHKLKALESEKIEAEDYVAGEIASIFANDGNVDEAMGILSAHEQSKKDKNDEKGGSDRERILRTAMWKLWEQVNFPIPNLQKLEKFKEFGSEAVANFDAQTVIQLLVKDLSANPEFFIWMHSRIGQLAEILGTEKPNYNTEYVRNNMNKVLVQNFLSPSFYRELNSMQCRMFNRLVKRKKEAAGTGESASDKWIPEQMKEKLEHLRRFSRQNELGALPIEMALKNNLFGLISRLESNHTSNEQFHSALGDLKVLREVDRGRDTLYTSIGESGNILPGLDLMIERYEKIARRKPTTKTLDHGIW